MRRVQANHKLLQGIGSDRRSSSALQRLSSGTRPEYRERLKQHNRERELHPSYEKWCPRCEVTKAAEEFHRNASTRDGLHWVCRKCNTKAGGYARHVEQRRRFRRYDITEGEVAALLQHQNHLCAICGIAFAGTEFHIDHCHASGAVRGLLCRRCNTALGLLGDDPKRLKTALNT